MVVNDSDEYFIMTEDGTGRAAKIPSFLISKSDGDILKEVLVCDKSEDASSMACDPQSQGLYIGWGLNFQPRAHYRVV